MGTTWRQHGDNMRDNVKTTWGPHGMWRPHGDNVETTSGQHGDVHGDVGDHMGTTWRQHGDNMRTMWRPYGDNSCLKTIVICRDTPTYGWTTWRQHG